MKRQRGTDGMRERDCFLWEPDSKGRDREFAEHVVRIIKAAPRDILAELRAVGSRALTEVDQALKNVAEGLNRIEPGAFQVVDLREALAAKTIRHTARIQKIQLKNGNHQWWIREQDPSETIRDESHRRLLNHLAHLKRRHSDLSGLEAALELAEANDRRGRGYWSGLGHGLQVGMQAVLALETRTYELPVLRDREQQALRKSGALEKAKRAKAKRAKQDEEDAVLYQPSVDDYVARGHNYARSKDGRSACELVARDFFKKDGARRHHTRRVLELTKNPKTSRR